MRAFRFGSGTDTIGPATRLGNGAIGEGRVRGTVALAAQLGQVSARETGKDAAAMANACIS
jgi:hypothetical protein